MTYDLNLAINNILANRQTVGNSVLITGKAAAQKKLAADEKAIRNAIADAGYTRNTGDLNTGLIGATDAYIGALTAVFDNAVTARNTYESKMLGAVTQLAIADIGYFSKTTIDGIEAETAAEKSALEINASYIEEAATLNIAAETMNMDMAHKVDLFNINAQSKYAVKTTEMLGEEKIALDSIAWKAQAESNLAIAKMNTTTKVMDVTLKNALTIAKSRTIANTTSAEKEAQARRDSAKITGTARVNAETVKSAATISGIAIKSNASITKSQMEGTARIVALQSSSAIDIANNQALSAADINNANVINAGRITNSANETAVEGIAFTTESNARVQASIGEQIAKTRNQEAVLKAQTLNSKSIIDGRLSDAKTLDSSRSSALSDKLTAQLAIIKEKSKSTIDNAKTIIDARTTASNDKLTAESTALANEMLADEASMSIINAAELRAVDTKSGAQVKNAQDETAGVLKSESDVQKARLKAQSDLIAGQLESGTKISQARAYSESVGIQNNADISKISRANESKIRIIDAAASAVINISGTVATTKINTNKKYMEEKNAIDNLYQTTYHIVN